MPSSDYKNKFCSDECRRTRLLQQKKAYRESPKGGATIKSWIEGNRDLVNAYAVKTWRKKNAPKRKRLLAIRNLRKTPNHKTKRLKKEQERYRKYYFDNAPAERLKSRMEYHQKLPQVIERRRQGAAAYAILVEWGHVPRMAHGQNELRRFHREARSVFKDMGLLDKLKEGN